MSRDIYQEVTSALVAAIEANPGDPVMPWHTGGSGSLPFNAKTSSEYHGVNILNLWITAQAKNYGSNAWASFRQWKALGASVRKGELSTPVVFYKKVTRENGSGEEEVLRILKHSSLFNAGQVEGWDVPVDADDFPLGRISAVEAMVKRHKVQIKEGGSAAFYDPVRDRVQMPDATRFTGADSVQKSENFHAVLLHEITHNAEVRIMPRRSS